MKYAFFGSSDFSIFVLEELKSAGLLPSIIVSTPDKPKGRKQILTATPVKEWAVTNNIPCITPAKLNADFVAEMSKENLDLFVVASYGKIIPQAVLDIPAKKCLNVHPSLLPKYRGASPLQSMILNDEKEIGVTIMLVDAEMDHGGIVSQEKFTPPVWPMKLSEFKKALGALGGKMLVDVMPKWIAGQIKEKEQNHAEATFTKKIEKEDGLIDLSTDSAGQYKNYLKICAFEGWPNTYFFAKNGKAGADGKTVKEIRVIINEADFSDGKLIIKKVTPEGRTAMSYQQFINSHYS